MYTLKSRYGLSTEEFERMAREQHGLCAICLVDPTTLPSEKGVLHVDHDHKTGAVRALLCNGCNRALGFIGDRSLVARRMAEYLERFPV